ncbi:potassium channel family protein [Nocardia sp. CA-084685]|uniref:potassium channel family protein n=1 Tax=Nocardia sp. CA-084685 TaxID=3239970 RepID=UPI003D972FD0
MSMHTVLIGYGTTGRCATQALSAEVAGAGVVIVDIDCTRTTLAHGDGVRAVLGDGSDTDTLRRAGVASASRVVVAVGSDREAVRITSIVRDLNPVAMVCTSLRGPGWEQLARYLGANQVVVTGSLVGRLLGLSVRRPEVLADFDRALANPPSLVVTERPVRPDEIGHDPARSGPLLLAVVRGGRIRWRDEPATSPLRAHDRLLVLIARWPDRE